MTTYKIDIQEMVSDVVQKTVKDYERIAKDRLDFGFDSIYFRYSEAIEELSYYKLKEARQNGNLNFDRKSFCDTRKMHFYNCLEQLLRCHEDGINDTH